MTRRFDFPLLPGSTLGVLGGGQLGRMLTAAARRMSYRVVTWSGEPAGGPAELSTLIIEDGFDSDEAFGRFVDKCHVATVEFENIPRGLLEKLAERMPLHPNARAVSICQHREREKTFLASTGFPCTPFHIIDSPAALAEHLAALPAAGGILKTSEFGYDGKGQQRVAASDHPVQTWEAFGAPRAVLEERIDIAGEVSVLVARDLTGEIACYDPVENIHRDHILDVSIVPARFDPGLLDLAREIAIGLAEALDYVGLLAVEFFIASDGRLMVNEMAPRPHNSGHHTIDACDTSQFEQQLRAICGLPLGSTRLHSPVVMLNLLGDVWPSNGSGGGDTDDEADDGGPTTAQPDWPEILSLPGSTLHLYGKADARKGRKMGHLTFVADSIGAAIDTQNIARQRLGLPPLPHQGASTPELSSIEQ